MIFTAGRVGGFRSWRATQGDVEVYFGGKGPSLDREAALRRVLPETIEPGWSNQIHSATVIEAGPGHNGTGDALVSNLRLVALVVVTADCVPVLLASGNRIAAVHAGWRGLAQSILPATLQRLDSPADEITAWIGPAIGPCCYEVGSEVALEVSTASSGDVVRQGQRGRPHLNLVTAARVQLTGHGVSEIYSVDACTRCDEGRLYSYRRDGPGGGRNVAAIWRSDASLLRGSGSISGIRAARGSVRGADRMRR